MKKIKILSAGIVSAALACSLLQYGCSESTEAKTETSAAPKTLSHAELVSRGKYLISAASCSDCHSPKILTPQGPIPDSTRALSGHPANFPFIPIDKKALKPGNWMLLGPDLTSFVGPFGITYAANLT